MTRSLSAPLLLAGLLVASTACAPASTSSAVRTAPGSTAASPGGESAAATQAPERTGRRDPNRLSVEEIQKVPATTAYEVVQRLRPLWLRQRGRDSVDHSSTLAVYVDGVRYGGVGSLRQLSPSGIRAMEYLDGPTATSRYGTGHTRGVISISTQ